MKVLTISIAAYHVEKYLNQCLDSFVIEDLLDKLEVLVINDGSGEKISDITMEYIKKYPQTFRLIEKENGGHGSTVNRGIEQATGKFFKTVDGDDYILEDGLRELICYLESSNADMVITPYESFHDANGRVLEQFCFDFEGIEYKKSYDFGVVSGKMYFVMHAITYRTKILQGHVIRLDHHCFYVDAEYCLYPIPWIHKVAFLEKTVYRYRLGLTTQSMDIHNMQKNCAHHEKVLEHLIKEYNIQKSEISVEAKAYIEKGIAKILTSQIKIYLSYPSSLECKREIVTLDKKIRQKYPEIYAAVSNQSVWILRKSGYLLYRTASWLCTRQYR